MRPLPPDRQSRFGRSPHPTRSRAWKLRQYLPHLQLEALAARLDEGGCFDFDYAPEDGDVLRVRLSGVWYRFRYAGTRERGAWSLDDSTGLTGWRAQMVSSSHGKLTTGD